MIYGIYQDLVHQNPGEHSDGVIAEYSKWHARRKKLVCMPTHCLDVQYGKDRKRFFGILSLELDGVCARKWNLDRVFIFQSVILQHAQGVNNSTQICKRILFLLDFWNGRAFEKLMKYTYN